MDKTSPDSSGCLLSRMLWVAKCMMRYCASSGLVAVARLASKSKALLVDPAGVTARIVSASRRVNGRRGNSNLPSISIPTSAAERSSRSATKERGEPSVSASAIPLVLDSILPGVLLAIFTRASSMSKTGSATTATAFGAGFRDIASRRNTANTEAEGRFTIS